MKSDDGSDDSVPEFGKLVSIDSIRIFAGGIGAVATYTKRAANDNLAVYSATLEKKDGAWKVVFGTATGQPPTDPRRRCMPGSCASCRGEARRERAGERPRANEPETPLRSCALWPSIAI